jgi:hypothetical protein
MLRSLAALAAMTMLSCGASARGVGAPIYIVTVQPAAQPGDNCIADGVSSGHETKTADGTLVLVQGVHGADTRRCSNPAFPNVATTQKLPPEQARSVPSVQCIPLGARVGEEIAVPSYGRAMVLQLHAVNAQCNRPGNADMQEATVIGAAAHRAAKAAQEASAPSPAPATPREPSEAEIRQEYDRLTAAAASVEEFHVRHILVRTREDAVAALERIRSGQPFGAVASDVSMDPGSRVKGGDLGWNVPASFIEEFSKTMVSLKPAGLATEPTRTRFGWHVIEVLATKMGKDSFPVYAEVRDRIAVKLKDEVQRLTRVGVAAVCRKMVAPELPAAAVREGASGTVVAEMRIENGKVAEVLSLSGPSVFHPAVTQAVLRYECDRFDKPVIATQSFNFKLTD